VASAGNEGRAKDNVGYPAKFDSVIAVSATDENDKIADFSSRGPAVEVAAPGVSILLYVYFSEPLRILLGAPLGYLDGLPARRGYGSPYQISQPRFDEQEIRRRLRTFAKDVGPVGKDNDYGYGIPQPERTSFDTRPIEPHS